MAILKHIYQAAQRVGLLSLLFCCVACNNGNDEPEARHIAFEIANSDGWNEMSRSVALDNTTLATEGFGVYAFYTEKSSWTANNTFAPNFMNNTKVTSSNNGTSWQYSPIKYWPHNQSDKVSFLAYAPHIDGKTINGTKIEYEVVSDVIDHKDLLWSNSKTENFNNQTQAVNFTFRHALARIGFTVTAKSDGVAPLRDGVKIIIKKVTIGYKPENANAAQFKNKGTLELYNSGQSASWSGVSGAVAYSIVPENFVGKATNGLALTKENTDGAQQLNGDDSYIMVLPQTFEANKLQVYVEYEVELSAVLNSGKVFVYDNYTNKCVGNVSTALDLQSGMTYIINIITDLKSAKVDNNISITKWENGGSINVGNIIPNE